MNSWRNNNRRRRKVREQLKPQESRPKINISFHPFGSFVAALRFLTILPLPGILGTSEEELTKAVPFFPLVGLLLGCLAVPIAWGLSLLLPPLPVAVLLIFLLAVFSGGLHLDGLADSADGFFSARPREQMLEIMHDSTIGPMGVIALVLLLLLNAACLASLSSGLIPAILLMPIAGRAAILLLMALLPYARSEGGLGSLFAPYFNNVTARMTALAGLIFLSGMAWGAAGAQGIFAVFAVLLLTTLFAVFCRRKIGGITGDTLGAACELAEAAVALSFAIKVGGIL